MIARRAACVLGLVLAGCASRRAPPAEPPGPTADGRAAISGRVVGVEANQPIADAVVILQCDCLQGQREVQSGADGVYRFAGLPGGVYTVQVLTGRVSVHKSMVVPAGKRLRANFAVDTELRFTIGCWFLGDLRSIDRSLFHDSCDGPTGRCRHGAPPRVRVDDLR